MLDGRTNYPYPDTLIQQVASKMMAEPVTHPGNEIRVQYCSKVPGTYSYNFIKVNP